MFLVINKSKILSYILAICTVVVLFMLATTEENNEMISTSANIISTNTLNTLNQDNYSNQENYIDNNVNKNIDNIV
jgi:hypothetical protein